MIRLVREMCQQSKGRSVKKNYKRNRAWSNAQKQMGKSRLTVFRMIFESGGGYLIVAVRQFG